jgi:PKD repeat protein
LLTGVQGLIASFHGSLINGMPASYLWQLGDGNVATGQDVTHMYASQGIYTVSLQTVTADGCTDSSGFTLMLMDSIPNGCASYFVATPTGNPKEMAFNAYTQSNYPTQFTWELGDGATATGQNLVHTYCCEGTYTILLTTTDSTGCSSTYTAPIVVTLDSTGTLMLGGQVFAGSNPIDFGMISLFRVDPSGSYFPVQTKLIDSLGFYNFWNLYIGTYLILAYPPPDSLSGNSYLPTYYGDVVFWEQATPISLGVPLNPYNINLVSYDSIGGGPGSVSGQLISGGKSISTGNMEVLLLDAYGTPVRITYTDPMGNFSFTSLPYGQYMVNPVVTGITVQTSPFILSATNPSVVVIMTINGNTITGISKKGKAPMVGGIHPNPAIDQVLVTLNAIGNIKIQISDASGRLVISETRNLSETGSEVTIHVKDLNPGLYFISIQDSEGNVSTSKMIKN